MRTLTLQDLAAVREAVAEGVRAVVPVIEERARGVAELGRCYSPQEFGDALVPRRSAAWVRREARAGRLVRAKGFPGARLVFEEVELRRVMGAQGVEGGRRNG
jgi:hypothetical protein